MSKYNQRDISSIYHNDNSNTNHSICLGLPLHGRRHSLVHIAYARLFDRFTDRLKILTESYGTPTISYNYNNNSLFHNHMKQ